MKKAQAAIIAFTALIFLASCSNKTYPSSKPKPATTKRLPPGQAKKVTGSQSAKPYAPGQQKKS